MADVELVIKIDRLKSGNYGLLVSNTCAYEVLNGTPLPKGHGRLIDADAILTKTYEKLEIGFDDYTIIYDAFVNTIKGIVNLTPTIIEADKGDKE
jgi:hypothetical protein